MQLYRDMKSQPFMKTTGSQDLGILLQAAVMDCSRITSQGAGTLSGTELLVFLQSRTSKLPSNEDYGPRLRQVRISKSKYLESLGVYSILQAKHGYEHMEAISLSGVLGGPR